MRGKLEPRDVIGGRSAHPPAMRASHSSGYYACSLKKKKRDKEDGGFVDEIYVVLTHCNPGVVVHFLC